MVLIFEACSPPSFAPTSRWDLVNCNNAHSIKFRPATLTTSRHAMSYLKCTVLKAAVKHHMSSLASVYEVKLAKGTGSNLGTWSDFLQLSKAPLFSQKLSDLYSPASSHRNKANLIKPENSFRCVSLFLQTFSKSSQCSGLTCIHICFLSKVSNKFSCLRSSVSRGQASWQQA